MWIFAEASSSSNDCQKCRNWYNKEKAAIERTGLKKAAWLSDLNNNFKCPCQVPIFRFSIGGYFTVEARLEAPYNWTIDPACSGAYNFPEERKSLFRACNKYHPGAFGCIKSERVSEFGARQQCCYDFFGDLIRPGLPGAGTPDRSGNFSKHRDLDLNPYKWCCQNCKSRKHCNYYINDLRKGDWSHCYWLQGRI